MSVLALFACLCSPCGRPFMAFAPCVPQSNFRVWVTVWVKNYPIEKDHIHDAVWGKLFPTKSRRSKNCAVVDKDYRPTLPIESVLGNNDISSPLTSGYPSSNIRLREQAPFAYCLHSIKSCKRLLPFSGFFKIASTFLPFLLSI